jgi:hypothetical protein
MVSTRTWIAGAAIASFLVVGIVAASLVALGGESSVSSAPVIKSERIAGARAIAEELNLEVLESPANLEEGRCSWAVDVEEDIYCLDSAAATAAEASAIVAEMRGSEASTDLEQAWWEAGVAYRGAERALAEAERSGTPEEIDAAREASTAALVDLHDAAAALDGGD